jgi:plasmid maintenance system killer protein
MKSFRDKGIEWCVTFSWLGKDADRVDYEDYH